jgi:hypothetical protein
MILLHAQKSGIMRTPELVKQAGLCRVCLTPPRYKAAENVNFSATLSQKLCPPPLHHSRNEKKIDSDRVDLIMADITLGTIGLVPVLVNAITTFRRIHRGVKAAKRCVEHLDAIAIDWKIQHGRFLNECVLLLIMGGEEEIVGRAMVKDSLHAGWTKINIASSIQRCLGESYDLCVKIIKRIEVISISLEKMMDCFDTVRSKKLKVRYDIDFCRASLTLHLE